VLFRRLSPLIILSSNMHCLRNIPSGWREVQCVLVGQ
jgi:hypothetical protein